MTNLINLREKIRNLEKCKGKSYPKVIFSSSSWKFRSKTGQSQSWVYLKVTFISTKTDRIKFAPRETEEEKSYLKHCTHGRIKTTPRSSCFRESIFSTNNFNLTEAFSSIFDDAGAVICPFAVAFAIASKIHDGSLNKSSVGMNPQWLFTK